MVNKARIMWPRKVALLGTNISVTSYEQALENVIEAARKKVSACVTHLAVHGLVEGNKDLGLRYALNSFDIVAPDGQPVRLALNLIGDAKLTDRCYGPEFMSRVCQQASTEGIGVYLYGSHQNVVEALSHNLSARFPGLRIVGREPSVFRPLTKKEDNELTDRINKSGAKIVFVGLGCPLQEKFAYNHRDKIKAVLICVGAAFDFHSGNKKMAPVWMQRLSLEWFFRLREEPRRLWKRYLFTNTVFLLKIFLQLLGSKRY
jgi:N-acetylglucosaminyldiphosphoundecaprenol N-acetyl-beta-D-mannosaminyltransferase